MAAFLRVVALLVALGNSYAVFVVTAVKDEQEGVKWIEVPLDPVSLVVAFAFFIGALLAAEILHRYTRSWLEANVLVRYLTLFAGITLGGLLAGLALSVEAFLLFPVLEEGHDGFVVRPPYYSGGLPVGV